MRKLLAALALLAGLVPAAAQVPNFPQTLPANSVVGRLGIGPGPSQAIPFAVLTGDLLNSLTPGAANALLWVDNNNVAHWSNAITGQNYLAAMTNAGEAFGYSFRNSTVTGNTIYGSIFPGVSTSDGIQSVLSIPATATVTQSGVIAAYLDNGVATSGGNRNGVLLFGAGRCTVDNSACWGINTLLQDASNRIAGTGNGRILVNEFDFNVMNPNTQVIGLSIGGNSLASPSVANGFIVNSLGGSAKWGTGFWCMGGTISGQCLAVGTSAGAGASVPSQNVLFQYYNAGSVQKNFTLNANNGVFNVFNNDTTSTLNVGFAGSSEGFLSLAGLTGGASVLGVQPTASGLVRLPNFTGTLPSTMPSPLIKDATTGAVTWTVTSGGLLYASSATSVASSAALAANGIVTGGGPGVAPSTAGGCSVDPTSSSLSCASSAAFSPGFILKNTTNDNGYVGHNLFKQRNTSIVQNGDGLGGYGFYGYDGSTFQTAAQILALVDGVPGVGSMPGRIVFNTTPSGSVTLAEAFRIDNSQRVQFAAPSIAANGAVSVSLSGAVGPTGSHATVQEWLVVKNASGVVRWIPMF